MRRGLRRRRRCRRLASAAAHAQRTRPQSACEGPPCLVPACVLVGQGCSDAETAGGLILHAEWSAMRLSAPRLWLSRASEGAQRLAMPVMPVMVAAWLPWPTAFSPHHVRPRASPFRLAPPNVSAATCAAPVLRPRRQLQQCSPALAGCAASSRSHASGCYHAMRARHALCGSAW